MGNRYLFIQFTVFHGQKGRHNFGNAGRVILGMHIFTVQNRSCGDFHNNAGFRNYGRAGGPSRFFVGLNGEAARCFRFTGLRLCAACFGGSFRIVNHFILNGADCIICRQSRQGRRKKTKRGKHSCQDRFPFIFHQGMYSL